MLILIITTIFTPLTDITQAAVSDLSRDADQLVSIVQPPLRPRAAPIATIVTNIPGQVPLGENFSFSILFDNTGDQVGYGPVIDLVLPVNGADGDAGLDTPDGIDFIDASYLGVGLTTVEFTFPDDDGTGPGTTGCIQHPYFRDTSGVPLAVCGTASDKLVIIELPFGSFGPLQPSGVEATDGISISVNANLSNLADVGIALPIYARAGFRFGADPLDNPCCDLLLVSPVTSNSAAWPSSSVSPSLISLAKTYSGPENETATGPNFPRQYTVSVSISDSIPVSGLTIEDVLPNNLQFLSVASTSPGSATCTTPSTSTPGGTLSCSFSTVVTSSASLTFNYYVPRLNLSGTPVLPPASGDDNTSSDNASASGNWTPIDGRDSGGFITIDGAGPEHTLNDRSIAVQKSVANVIDVGGAGATPNDTLEYTLSFQVSDFFAFENIQINDLLSDGQHFDSGFTPTLSINATGGFSFSTTAMGSANFSVMPNYTPASPLPNDGTTALTFRVSDEIASQGGPGGRMVGGCIPPAGTGGPAPDCAAYDDGPTMGTLIYRAIIQDEFTDTFPSGDRSVDQGDLLQNTLVIIGSVLQTNDLSPSGQSETDGSSAGVTIARATVTKSIYAINGGLYSGGTPQVKPGDTITYRITYEMPSSDIEDLHFHDFLPLPVFRVDDADADNNPGPVWAYSPAAPGTIPAPGVVSRGPADTFTALFGITPSVVSDSLDNSLLITYGTHDDPLNQSTDIDLLLTITVTADPFADGLFLTNQVRQHEGSTNAGEDEADVIIQIEIQEPFLTITKGTVSSDNPSGIFDPTDVGPASTSFSPPGSTPSWNGSITSSGLGARPVDSDLSGVDAGDTVTFAIVIENLGSSPRGAFDIQVRDTLPSGFSIPTTPAGLNLTIRRGNGNAIGHTPLGPGSTDADLFTNGLELIDPSDNEGVCAGYDLGNGANIVILTYDLILTDAVLPEALLENTATLQQYSSVNGAGTTDNFVADENLYQDDATVTVATPLLSKAITDTNQGFTSGTQVAIGEIVEYTLTIAIPEGISTAASLTDTLDQGLVFVALDAISAPSSALSTNLAGGFASILGTEVISNQGHTMAVDFGDLTNTNRDNSTPETITLVYRVVVLNVAGNQASPVTLLNNSAVWDWTGGTTSISAPNATVVEPLMEVVKVANPPAGDAGDTISFTLTIAHAAGSNADAFELALDDTLPAGMTLTGGTLNCTGGSLLPDTCAFVGDTLTATWDQINGFPLGSTSVFSFDVTLDSTVSPGQVIDNTANLTWTGLPGDVTTSLSPHSLVATERTGDITNPGGTANDYRTAGTAQVTITSGPAKSIVSTSEAHTGFVSGYERVVIGEIIRYRLTYQIPEGTGLNFRLQDGLPTGLRFLHDGTTRAALVSNDAGIVSPDFPPATNPTLYVTGNSGAIIPVFVLPDSAISSSPTNRNADTYGSGTDVYFWFGDLVNNDRDEDQEFVVVEFNALVENIAGNQAYNNVNGATLTTNRNNNFRSRVGSGASEILGTFSNSVQVSIAEPLITNLSKTITVIPSDAGDTVVYQFVFINSSTGVRAAAAFDLVLSDTLDANLTYQNIQLISVTGGDCGSVTPTFSADVSSLPLVRGTLTCLNPGATATVHLTATVANNAPIAGTIDNSVTLTFTSLPGANGTASNPTGSTTTGLAGTAIGERTGENGVGGLNDYVDTANVSITLIDPAITKTVFGTSLATTGSAQHNPLLEDLVIGETVTFRITVTLPEGSAPLTITDNLPIVPPDEGILSLVSSQVISIGANISGSSLTIGDAGVSNDSDSDGYDDQVVFDFSTLLNVPDGVVNDDDRITVEVVARVVNETENQNGDLLVNDTIVDYGTGTQSASASVDLIVVDLAVTKDDSLSIISPAEVLTYAINYSNVGTADAYAVVLSETVPNGTSFSGPSGPGGWSCSPGDPGGTACTFDAGDLLIGANGSVNFIVVVNDPAGVTSVVNTVTVGDDSSHGPDADTTNNSFTDTDNLATLPDANMVKTLVDTDQPHTGLSNVAIGERITYEVVLIVPEGTAPASFLIDTLERGLAFVDCDSIVVSGGLTTTRAGGFTAACDNPVISEEPSGSLAPVDEGRRISYDLGDLTSTKANPIDPDPTLTITYRAVVLNSGANLRGAALANTVHWTWNGGDLEQSASAATIVEPTLTLVKDATPRIAPLGTPITISLTVGHTTASDADAFDLILEDILPPEMIFAGGLTSTAGPVPTSLNETAGTIDARWDDFPLGSTSTIEFQITLNSLAPGERISNEARLEWTSLPEDNVRLPRSLGENDLATERRYDPTNLIDVYQVIASIDLGIPALPETGFTPGRLTQLPKQPAEQVYAWLDGLRLEIPSIGVEAPIVGVSTDGEGWDLTWLWNRIGFLEGTAYPSWAGNTALTGHVVLSNGLPGPFARLDDLAWNDRILLYTNGLRYEYRVTYSWQTHPNDLSVLRHDDLDVLTLITCADYEPSNGIYRQRTIVRAILVQVDNPSLQH